MVKVAVLGFGVVGSGVCEVLSTNAESIAKKAGSPIEVKYILDLRDFPESPFSKLLIKDFSIIENDPEISVVAEMIGGATHAYDFVKRSLLAGKHVVTSNKELVAAKGAELLSIAEERNINFLFEASVGGGIPIIRPLSQCLSANNIEAIYGILNGTTNYILTRMIKSGLSFEDALREAQEKGYAEANPAADVDGLDACRKICILASLSFGRHLYPDFVPTSGISALTLLDIRLAREENRVVKLLGRAERMADGRVFASVSPCLVKEGSPLATVEDVFNGIVVEGDATGDVMFYGRGAGKFPTASAVIADIIDATRNLSSRKYNAWADGDEDMLARPSMKKDAFYLRVKSEELNAAENALASYFGKLRVLASESKEISVITEEADWQALADAKKDGSFEIIVAAPLIN